MQKVKSQTAAGTEIYCSFDKLVPIEQVKPNPENPNKHPNEQIEMLAKIINGQGWRTPITISNRSGLIVRGHARLMAAENIGEKDVPVDYQDYDSQASEYADLIADNRIAELAEMDNVMLKDVIEGYIDTGELDLEMTGYREDQVEGLMTQYNTEGQELDDYESQYTDKSGAPQYNITGAKPDITDLFENIKYDNLMADIEQSDLPEAEKNFLRLAATRHIVFTYSNIAEYYAHASPEMQELMEQSALIVVDYNDAMRNGYVHIKNTIQGIVENEQGEIEEC